MAEDVVGRLATLLSDGTPSDREQALRELCSLANHFDAEARQRNVAAMLAAGLVEPLVATIREGSAQNREPAAGALRGASGQDGRPGTDEHGTFASVRSEMWKAHAVDPLVALLSEGTAEGQEHAAGALRNLMVRTDDLQAIARAGAVQPLLALLREGTDGCKMQAAPALCNLALDPESKPAIDEGLQQAGWSLAPVRK